MLPADMLSAPQRRDLVVQGGTHGEGALVGEQNLSFVNMWRSDWCSLALPGVEQHTNLRADEIIVRQETEHTTTWLALDGQSEISASQPTFGTAALTPKTLAVSSTLSRQLVLQAGPAMPYVFGSVANAVAEGVNSALFNGSGADGQPLGLFVTDNVDVRAGTSFALADAAAMLKVCEGFAFADTVTWVAGVDTAEKLRQRPKAASGEVMLLNDDNKMLGADVIVSRCAPAAQLLVLQWAQLHFASWGVLEIAVDVFTNYRSGKVVLRALWRVDFAVDAPTMVAAATAVT